MTGRSFRNPTTTTAICTLVLLTAAQFAAAQAPDAGQLLGAGGLKSGIVVQLGCENPQLCLDLHAGGQCVVQALDRDPENVETARSRIEAQGCYGPMSARLLTGDQLPQLDNLVNLLVVDDPLGISEQEMLRVVRPLGVVMLRQGGDWKKIVKPWPAELDEWTHFLYDATGNAVSKDDKVGPPRRLQWSAGPMWGRSHETNNSVAAMVTARGRMFHIFDRGLTGMEDPRLGQKWILIARDAFNGSMLWERPLPEWGMDKWQTSALRFFGGDLARRLVAVGDRLYFTLGYGGGTDILDAATGKTLGSIPGTEGTVDIIVDGDRVVVSSLVQIERNKITAAITCYDAASKKVVWRAEDKNVVPQLLVVGSGKVIYHNKASVVCLNLADGSRRWEYADTPTPGKGGGKMLLLADGRAVLSSRKQIVALGLTDGVVAWQAPGVQGDSMREFDLFYARGKIWCSGPDGTIVGYDLDSGEQTTSLDVSGVQSEGHHLRCYRAKATENYLITQFRGIEYLSLGDDTHKQHDWLRGTCTYGVMPANGFLYVPPHSCFCFSAAMYKGLNAFAGPSEREEKKHRGKPGFGPLEKGPAYGFATTGAEASAKSWPSYRHDARRTGASASKISGTPERRWKVALGTDLTPPVAADGRVLVAAKNRHTLLALDAATGEKLWSFAADGRIDSPPSIHRGLIVFGSADGFLYCLRAEDGALAWRRRMAPEDLWMAVDGQLESVWRVHGSVTVVGDLAYLSAGRSSYLDGGLAMFAVDIPSGEVRHRSRLNTVSDTRVDAAGGGFVPSYHIEGAHSDVLTAEGGFIYLNQMKFSPELELQPAKYLTKEEVTARPSMNLDNKEYVNEDIFKVQFRGQTMSNYDKLATILVDEETGVGERDLGLHLFTTSGFLDTSFFNRTYWMYGPTWTGFNHANLASKSGQILVIGPENTYSLKAYTSRYPLSPKLDPATKGYLLVADDNSNEPTLDPRAWAKDKGMGFSRGAPPEWHQWLPVRVVAMTLAGDTLVVCGPPDVVKAGDPMAAFEGRLGSELWTVSATNGETISKQKLDEMPLFDGIIAADDQLYLSTQAGEVICMGP